MRWAIFDLDGTLTDCSWRSRFAERAQYLLDRGYHDDAEAMWRKFHQFSIHDLPHDDVLDILRAWINVGNAALYVTGRPEHVRQRTIQWFAAWEIPIDTQHLFMRPNDSLERTDKYKSDVLEHILTHVLAPSDILSFAIDDDDRCVMMYRDADVPCLQPRPKQY